MDLGSFLGILRDAALSKADGTPIGAVFGFTSMLMNLLEKYKDSYLVVIFDAAP